MRVSHDGNVTEKEITIAAITNIAAIVLAGDAKSNRTIRETGQTYRDAAIASLVGIPAVTSIIAVTNSSLGHMSGGKVRSAFPGNSAAESLSHGCSLLTVDCWILIIAADLPHITEEAVTSFLSKTTADRGKCVFLAYSSLSECAELGHTSKHGVKLDGQQVKLASIFLVHSTVLKGETSIIAELLRDRKSPLLIGIKLLGLKWALRYLLRKNLNSLDLQSDIAKRCGFPVIGVRTTAKLAVDDDTK